MNNRNLNPKKVLVLKERKFISSCLKVIKAVYDKLAGNNFLPRLVYSYIINVSKRLTVAFFPIKLKFNYMGRKMLNFVLNSSLRSKI